MRGERLLQRLEQRIEPANDEWEPWQVSADEAESILQILFEAGGVELVESVIGIEIGEADDEDIETSQR